MRYFHNVLARKSFMSYSHGATPRIIKAAKLLLRWGGGGEIWQVGGVLPDARGAWAGVICIHPPPYILAHTPCHDKTSSERRTASEEKDKRQARSTNSHVELAASALRISVRINSIEMKFLMRFAAVKFRSPTGPPGNRSPDRIVDEF